MHHIMIFFEIIMGSTKSKQASDIASLIQSRLEAHKKKCREEIDATLESIKAKSRKSSLHDPLYSDRPYGLAGEMEGARKHVWDLIFEHVNDWDAIVSLREVCMMFRELLERKYVATRIPEIIVQCLEQQLIPWDYGSRIEFSVWVKTLSSLRILSKTTKESVDYLFDRGLLLEQNWFTVGSPYLNYNPEYWKVPTLIFGALDEEQERLENTLTALGIGEAPKDYYCPRCLLFNESRGDFFPVDLEELRSAFGKCLEKIGSKITSFCYSTRENPVNAYNILRKWLAHMPNLEQLMIQRIKIQQETIGMNNLGNLDPFPICPKLKDYAEGGDGFGCPFINEIMKANPTIENILLTKLPSSSSSDVGVVGMKHVLDTLPMKNFYCTCTPTIAFLDLRFKWSLELTTLALWDSNESSTQDIPSKKMFDFISSFENLENLLVSSTRVRDTGGYLKLAKLETVYWKVLPKFSSLEFLKPVESLKWLVIDLSGCHPDFKTQEKLMEYLGEWHIPALFPALRSIEMIRERNLPKKKIWEP